MSTKRSRQVRSSKLIAPDEIQDLINSSDEDSKEKLTDEQSKINQKLSECGLLEEDLNWKEKQEIYSSITASVNTAEFEEKRRSSNPSQENTVKARKILSKEEAENSANQKLSSTEHVIDVIGLEDEPIKVDKSTPERRIILSNVRSLKQTFIGKTNGTSSPTRNQILANREQNINWSSSILDRRTPFVSSDGDEKEVIECEISDDEDLFVVSRKRPSPSETDALDSAKKFRTESPLFKMTSSVTKKPLRTEIEHEKKLKSISFKMRSAETILRELEEEEQKLRMANSKCKVPVRWGSPIVKVSDKWDLGTVPPKLLERYEKFLSSKGSQNSVPFPSPDPKNSQNDDEVVIVSKVTNIEARTPKPEPKTESKLEKHNEFRAEAGLTVYDIPPRQQENKRALRNKKFTKLSSEEEPASCSDEEWVMLKQKSSKKKSNNKNGAPKGKPHPEISKKCYVKLERFPNSSKLNDEDCAKRSGSEMKKPDVIEQIAENSTSQPEVQLPQKTQPSDNDDDESVDCPICSNSFKRSCIEAHATECATKTFQD